MISALIFLSYINVCLQNVLAWNPAFVVVICVCMLIEFRANGVVWDMPSTKELQVAKVVWRFYGK